MDKSAIYKVIDEAARTYMRRNLHSIRNTQRGVREHPGAQLHLEGKPKLQMINAVMSRHRIHAASESHLYDSNAHLSLLEKHIDPPI